MINVSTNFKKKMFDGVSDFIIKADITLVNQTVLHLTNEDIWSNGLSIEDAVSSTDSFDVGAAIIGKLRLIINNIYDQYSEYDFGGAEVIVYLGLHGTLENPNGTLGDEVFRKGTYKVDEAIYNGSIITLTCYDRMNRFNKPYSNSTLKYPATLYQIVNDACSRCDVTLSSTSLTFPHYSYQIPNEPDKENCTFRQVISWVAQIAGCFCRIDPYGKLELKWYDQTLLESVVNYDGGTFDTNTTPYSDGVNLDGGTFNYNESTSVDQGDFLADNYKGLHHIYSVSNANISTDDVVITNVRIVEKNVDSDNKETTTTYNKTSNDGYVILIEKNDLIHNGKGQEICNWLGTQLVGFRFRKGTIEHASNPTIEAGDVGYYTDYKQATYRFLFSCTTFNAWNYQQSVSSAQRPSKNSDARYSATTQNCIKIRKDLEKEITDREQSLIDMGERLNNSPGAYTTQITTSSGGKVFYLHDKPKLSDSAMVWRLAAEAWQVTNQWKGDDLGNPGNTVWLGGMDASASFIATVVQATKISFDNAEGGIVKLGGRSNGNGTLEIYDASGTKVGYIDNDGINFSKGAIHGPSIVAGSSGNANGTIKVKNASGTEIVVLDNTGITAKSGTIQGPSIIAGGNGNANGTIVVKNASNADVVKLNNSGIEVLKGTIKGASIELGGNNDVNGTLILKKANGTEALLLSKDGVKVTNGTIDGPTINGGTINGGTFNVGYNGQNKTNGTINVKNSSGETVATLDINGLKTYGNGVTTTFANGEITCSVGSSQYGSYGLTKRGTSYEFGVSGSDELRINANKVYLSGSSAVGIGGGNYNLISWNSSDDKFNISSPVNANSGSFKSLYAESLTIKQGWFEKVQSGQIVLTDIKARKVSTNDYNDRLLYCYETPSPMFGDIGSGITDENGFCLIDIEDIFSETISTDVEYQVFLQKEGRGDLWISEKHNRYFIVEGTPNLKFSWELKAIQKDFEWQRLEEHTDSIENEDTEKSFEDLYAEEIEELLKEQEELLYETA